MRHWTHLGDAPIPGSDEILGLYQGKDDFHITIRRGKSGRGGGELMSSRKHASEDALGRLPCAVIKDRPQARVLVGGLGMGFTLAAALEVLGKDATVVVGELIPEVVEWNRGPLGECSGRPLEDPRTDVHVGDVVKLLKTSPNSFDAIALDIDNGPEGLTTRDNDSLYSTSGINTAKAALKPGGVLAYWSAGPDKAFVNRLRQAQLKVQEHQVYAHGNKGVKHTLWVATK